MTLVRMPYIKYSLIKLYNQHPVHMPGMLLQVGLSQGIFLMILVYTSVMHNSFQEGPNAGIMYRMFAVCISFR